MAMIASVNILMSAKHGRWLTKKELLGTQGFLTDTKHTFGVPCSSYALREWNARRGIASEPWPSHRAACQQGVRPGCAFLRDASDDRSGSF